MWEECGMAFRSNTIEAGGRIPLHSHGNPHMAIIRGDFTLTLVSPEGNETTRQAYNLERIGAGWQHEFLPRFTHGVGEVLCFCPADRGF